MIRKIEKDLPSNAKVIVNELLYINFGDLESPYILMKEIHGIISQLHAKVLDDIDNTGSEDINYINELIENLSKHTAQLEGKILLMEKRNTSEKAKNDKEIFLKFVKEDISKDDISKLLKKYENLDPNLLGEDDVDNAIYEIERNVKVLRILKNIKNNWWRDRKSAQERGKLYIDLLNVDRWENKNITDITKLINNILSDSLAKLNFKQKYYEQKKRTWSK